MTAKQVIREIDELSPVEQAEVIRHAYRLDAERQLSGAELTALATRMVAAEDPAEQARIRAEIMRGFYGGKVQAKPTRSSKMSATARARLRDAMKKRWAKSRGKKASGFRKASA
jgi:hypothetical protein